MKIEKPSRTKLNFTETEIKTIVNIFDYLVHDLKDENLYVRLYSQLKNNKSMLLTQDEIQCIINNIEYVGKNMNELSDFEINLLTELKEIL